ncbi:Down-regulated-in-metastasis protein [Lasiodiplodia theobromae]|uniref:Down-regulated-in-metastasis protein n=1 Tax=Lasiodiplodia theobromae TaxID=45133 RepID=UPI0015C3715E|nr:Down-regulated-in-metastasis protein [Lasiodiplodia theobromae]KAF4540927.1 Down-regulated-in-metastasis protein [Lasiodiplodia theobromae]
MAVVSQAKRKKTDRVSKPKKGGTESSRKHHFESFSQRIAKLNIDPIRRTTRRVDDHDLSNTTSYLKNSFEEWKDLNLSENFNAFSRELDPLCESLPQILHHADRIMDLLIRYIEKRDALSLEPLLSLVSHFAHDLGVRFEKYFARAVQTVCQVAAKHPDIEVIEWSFTCLAWLFKYLSRLLVPDLRPLYDLMAPLLGKEHQKSFVTRFAAESMSFLVRKAGASYHRDKEPLQVIVSHALNDLEALAQRDDASQYQQGLMSLFVDSVKGIQNGLHSSAEAILKVLLEQALAFKENDSLVPGERPAMDVVQGVLTATIHHTNSETFRPVLQIVLDQIDAPDRSKDTQMLENAARLLFTVAGVRKGTRVADWSSLMRTTSHVVASAEHTIAAADSTVVSDVLAALAVILQLCPMDVAIPHLRILDTISSGSWQQSFLYFCNFFSELGTDRFQSILLPHFKKFIVSRWRQEEQGLAILLPRLAGRAWQESIINSFKKLAGATPAQAVVEGDVALCNAYLDIVRLSSVDPATEAEMYKHLYDLLSGSLDADLNDLAPEAKLGVGAGFKYVAENQNEKSEDKALWASLCSASANLNRYPKFAEAILRYLKIHSKGLDMSENHVETLVDAAIESLGSPSHDLRASSLEILQLIYTLKHDGTESDLLSTAILIESTPISIQTARTVSMNIRRLAVGYKNAVDDSWIARAIPTFCFGLLYVNYTQVWEDSCSALKEMCETKEGETVVSELAFKWLEDVPPQDPSTLESPEKEPSTTANFRNEHKEVVFITGQSRSQALKVLNAIPQVAEKKSRSLVPTLLRWATGNANVSEDVPGDGKEPVHDDENDQSRWARKDQKAMLGLFTKFTNPKVLYKAADVYSALLTLLGNGDVEIQKSALKAILTWKTRSINRYEENLMNILDDARFREQISVFLDLGQDDDSMKDEDRPEVMPRGQESRRKAVFIALSKFGDDEIRQFLDIALGPLANVSLTEESRLREEPFDSNLMDARKQFGLLNMLEDMLDTLGTQMGPFAVQLVDPVLYYQKEASGLSLLNSIRQVGFHCLNGLFAHCAEFERLEKLAVETAQSVSGILRLFSAWSKFPQTAPFLVKYNGALLDKAVDCLELNFAKEQVKLFVLRDILMNVIALAEADSMDVDEPPKSAHILSAIGRELQGSPSKELLDTGVSTVSRLAPFVAGSVESESMIRISLFLLQQPTRRCGLDADAELTREIYRAICSLFSYFQDRKSRGLLCNILNDLAQTDSSLSEVSNLATDLNSFSESRLDEPDFDRRSKAYYKINEERYQAFTIKQWLPLVYNMLFYIKEQEELMLRINASYALRRFVEAAARDGNKEQEDFQQLITAAVIPGIQNGVREKSELVRVEYLSVLAQIVRFFPSWPVVSDMHVLLVGDDDEASIFSNILHIQQHRRLRAMRRLADEASKISSANISHIFIPLIEHFIFDRDEDDSGAANLAGETTKTIGLLALWLEWPQYRALLRRYSQGEMDKTTIKLLGVFIDSLSKAAEAKGLVSAPRIADAADEEMVDADSPEETSAEKLKKVGLARTMPSKEKLSTDLTNNLLPPLVAYIHNKDESTVSLRVPVAVIVVKLLRLLPATDRDQQARDMTRSTLADISALIGPEYFGFLLKALCTALQRGYQLHVLSFTVHSILVAMTPTFKPGELDYCLNDIVSVVMDDIFGVTGQEKDAEEYISKMKEVKSSKSFDSMELVAKTTTIKHLIHLVDPIRSLLLEKLDIKMVKKIDELLRRMGLGIMHNEAIHDREILVFCYQLIQEVYKSNADSTRNKEEEDYRTRRYLINMKAANKNPNRGATSSQIHKLIRFSLDVMRFMPVIGDAIVSGQEEIQMSAVRLLSSVIKDTNTELAQACLKLISAVLRERRNTSIKEKDVAYLLKKIVIVEVYEILDTVASVMFLMDYPQSKERLSKQIAFLVKNLDYKYKEGRQSVMEAINLLMSKLGDELAQEIADNLEMAGLLLKKVFERADAERTKKFVNIMKTWLEQEDQSLKRRLAIQCFTLYFEVPDLIDEARERKEEGDWELIYYSLQAFAKLCKLLPSTTFAVSSQPIWTTVRGCLTYPHAWVKLSAARLIGLYFADFASHNAADGYAEIPLAGSGGLQLAADDMLDLTSASLRILRVPGVGEELATQAVRNLVFLGRCFGVNGLEWKTRSAADEGALKEAGEESSSSDSDDDGEDDEAAVPDKQATTPARITALHYLFTRLSLILRRDPATTRAPALFPKTASMTLLAALCNALPATALEPSLPTILLPLHNLTDPSIPPPQSLDEDFNEAQKGLSNTATEVMGLLQKKLGTSEYLQVMNKVREGVKQRREGRRVKRALDRVAEPERAEREKRRKRERGKERRKEKGHEARGRRRGW